jgi:hypothetical protein
MEEIINQLANTDLSEKQLRAVACLVLESSKAAAARCAGIDVSTLHRWLHIPAFRQAVIDARRVLLADLFAEVRGQAEALVRR